MASEFTSLISRYHHKVKTDLDRKLLLGVLVRDSHLEQQAKVNQHLADIDQTLALEDS